MLDIVVSLFQWLNLIFLTVWLVVIIVDLRINSNLHTIFFCIMQGSIMRLIGSVENTWFMRFEAKHRPMNIAAPATQSRIKAEDRKWTNECLLNFSYQIVTYDLEVLGSHRDLPVEVMFQVLHYLHAGGIRAVKLRHVGHGTLFWRGSDEQGLGEQLFFMCSFLGGEQSRTGLFH